MKIGGIVLTKKRIAGFAAAALMLSLVLAGTVSALTTGAWFFDVETSNGNSFNAGSLDLKLDGGDENIVKFAIDNIKPDDVPNKNPQLLKEFVLTNAGTISGYLDVSWTVVSSENGILEPEATAGDTTENEGELDDELYCGLYYENNGVPGFQPSGENKDVLIKNGRINTFPKRLLEDLVMEAGQEVVIAAEFSWFTNNSTNNLAMGDSLQFDITFDLSQVGSR